MQHNTHAVECNTILYESTWHNVIYYTIPDKCNKYQLLFSADCTVYFPGKTHPLLVAYPLLSCLEKLFFCFGVFLHVIMFFPRADIFQYKNDSLCKHAEMLIKANNWMAKT